MGEHYQAIALEDIELATKAYIARWVALGERYREDTVNSDRVVAANNARWNALGDHYQMIALEDTELAAEGRGGIHAESPPPIGQAGIEAVHVRPGHLCQFAENGLGVTRPFPLALVLPDARIHRDKEIIALLEHALGGRRGHFSQMRSWLPGISDRALTLALRALGEAGLTEREVLDGYPPRTAYRVLPPGGPLVAVLRRM